MSVAKERNKKIIIIDSNSVIHRAYHALPPLTRKNGELVNAVYGFLLVFFKAIKDCSGSKERRPAFLNLIEQVIFRGI